MSLKFLANVYKNFREMKYPVQYLPSFFKIKAGTPKRIPAH